jgi:ribosomal protein S18 acetylase RimI-like enzyme
LLDLSIRVAEESDLPAAMTLVRACIEDMRRRGIEQWDEIYPARDRLVLDVAEGSLYVATSDDEPLAGMLVLNDYQDAEYADVSWGFLEAPVGVVHRLMVDPTLQGRGIARRLMASAERLAVERGFAVLRLDAFSLNPPALRLYRGLGYHEAGSVVFRKGVFHCFEKRLGAES